MSNKASPKINKPEQLAIPSSSPLSAKEVQRNATKFNLDIPKTSKIPSEQTITELDAFMREYAEKLKTALGDTVDQFLEVQRNATKFNLDIPKTSKIPSEQTITELDVFMREYAEKLKTALGDTVDQFLANFSKANDERLKSNVVEGRPEEVTPFPFVDESNNEYDTTTEEESIIYNYIPSSVHTTKNLFKGLKFTLFGWGDDGEEFVTEMIHQAGGMIHPKEWTIPPDYVVVPELGTIETYDDSVVVTVTNIWLEDCIGEKKILDVEFYHKPVGLSDPEASPLQGCVIALRSYKPQERYFVYRLIGYLGAEYADVMSRNLTPTTHLICPTPLGSKCNTAVTWGIHVVTHNWLLACAKQCKRVPEELFTLNQNNTPPQQKIPTPTKNVDTPNQIPNQNPINSQAELSQPMTPVAKRPRLNSTPRTPVPEFFKNIGLPEYGAVDNSPYSPHTPTHVSTPDAPLGRCVGVENPSPATRKYWAKRINALPNYYHSPKPTARPFTSFTELRDQFWRKRLTFETKDDSRSESHSHSSDRSEAPTCSAPTESTTSMETPSKNEFV